MKISIGDDLFFPAVRGYGGHGAHVKVLKVNLKSLRGVEDAISYKPGQRWAFPVGTRLCRKTYNETVPYVTEKWFTLGENGEML